MYTRLGLGIAAAVASTALAGPSWAADKVERPAPVVARPVVVAPPSWTGLYVGGHIGWGWARWSGELVYDAGLGPVPIFDPSHRTIDANGVLGGLQAGFNHQAGALVIGLESDVSWTGIKNTAAFTATTGYTWTITNRVDWFSTVRGRIGLTHGRMLGYATFGAAFGQASSSETVTSVGQGFPPDYVTANGSVTENHIGWAAGGGAEFMLSRSWSVKAEYLYADLGRGKYRYIGTAYPDKPACAPSPPAVTCSFPNTTDSFPAKLIVQSVRLGVNYLF